MRLCFIFLLAFTWLRADAQRIEPCSFRFTLTDSNFDSGKNRITYAWKYKKNRNELIISKPAGKLYTIKASEAIIRDMSIDNEGRIVVSWSPLKDEMGLSFVIEKHEPWSSPGMMHYKLKNLSAADYARFPYWKGTWIEWDLSYKRDLKRFRLITPTVQIENKVYRDFTCLFAKTCEPVWEKREPAPGVFIDSSAFFLRQQQLQAAFIQVGDSLMRSRFTPAGLGNYFRRICVQRTCDENGQPLYGFYKSSRMKCIEEPDTLCRQAMVVYEYFHNGQTAIPLKLYVKVELQAAMRVAFFEETNSVPPVVGSFEVRQLNLLSVDAMKKKAAAQFPGKEFLFREEQSYYGEKLSPAYAFLQEPLDSMVIRKPVPGKFQSTSPLILDISPAGKTFRSGYMYQATLVNAVGAEQQLIFFFDAVTGDYLYKTQVVKQLTEKQ